MNAWRGQSGIKKAAIVVGCVPVLTLLCGLCLISLLAVIEPDEAVSLPTRVEQAQAPTLPPTFTAQPVPTVSESASVAVAPGPTDTREPTQTSTPERLPGDVTQEEAAAMATERAVSLSVTEQAAAMIAAATASAAPTVSPYSFVTTLLVDGWAITLERVMVTDRIPGISGYSVARGRYAILYLAVRNELGYTSTFVPFGSISVFDEYGREYEEDHGASFDAWYHLDADLGADMAPGETAHIVAAYDLLGNESAYFIGPGVLADPQPNRIRFNAAPGNLVTLGPRPTATLYVPAYNPPPPTYAPPPSGGGGNPGGCCRHCTTGKPCGNSCISRGYTCHQPPGCACYGAIDSPQELVFFLPNADISLALAYSQELVCLQ